MRKVFLSIAAVAAAVSCAYAAEESPIILDLSKSTTELTFNAENGSWTGTYDEDAESIESQCFSFLHSAIAELNTWWGFTASDSADDAKPENTLDHQWSNMAEGGILLNEDGTVKLDDFGAPSVSAEMPYLVGFYSPYMSARPVDVLFNDGRLYDPQSVYVNLNSYTFYSVLLGDGYARAFTNNDELTLTIHGVAADETEKTVDVSLASCSNGDLTTARGWKYVDLTPLGTVNELYFTISTTDTGAYGANTPLYFCLDKLCVTPAVGSGAAAVSSYRNAISYDRNSKTVTLNGTDFAAVYDSLGAKVMQSDDKSFSLASLPAGVYVVKSGNSSIKIVR
ncbi:MAG: DUF4465 domain-containing protein [Muribaculaceae bacterium]|nr:DUF4465 domain-containing protein [Muribaculaceae bacterium]